MTYTYSSQNRIIKPCSYMYTPFEGSAFLEDFRTCRRQFLAVLGKSLDSMQRLDAMGGDIFSRAATAAQQLAAERLPPALTLESMSIDSPIDTQNLLLGLLSALQERGAGLPDIKLWADRLVQRFEVTKKIYAAYRSGLRTGHGTSSAPAVYALLALFLALYYRQNRSLKYLNTLLKVNDLLCSVFDQMAAERSAGLCAWFAVQCEQAFFQELLVHKGLADAIA